MNATIPTADNSTNSSSTVVGMMEAAVASASEMAGVADMAGADLERAAAYAVVVVAVLPVLSWLRRRCAVSLAIGAWVFALFGLHMARAEASAASTAAPAPLYLSMPAREWDLFATAATLLIGVLAGVYVFSLNNCCVTTMALLAAGLWVLSESTYARERVLAISLRISAEQIALLVLTAIPGRLRLSVDSDAFARRRQMLSVYGNDDDIVE